MLLVYLVPCIVMILILSWIFGLHPETIEPSFIRPEIHPEMVFALCQLKEAL